MFAAIAIALIGWLWYAVLHHPLVAFGLWALAACILIGGGQEFFRR